MTENLINENITFCFTKDNTVGLFNHDVNDIYHSSYGAKTEAEEKFIYPLNFEKNFFHKKNIKVLDICFGIGYNSKAFIEKILQTKYRGQIHIDALEYDKNLVALSPFIKDGHFKRNPEISFLLYKELNQCISSKNDVIKNTILMSENKKYFTPFYRRLIKKNCLPGYKHPPKVNLYSFLHNIYYHCISTRIKRAIKPFKYNKITLTPHFEDARQVVLSLKEQYDIIFLDAFTPAKLPTLWSLDFFKELYRLSSDDCMLVTYSNSAAIRHAMLESGFQVGKIFDKNNRISGTVASKNGKMIDYPLNDYDIGLLNTNAGIYYRDINLKMTADEILCEHEQRRNKLGLMSSSQYIKKFKREQNNEQI